MYKNLLSWLSMILLLPSCSDNSPNISVVCEENNVGNCIIKWETAPLIKGQVKIYASMDPEMITEDIPVAMADIANQQLTVITNNPKERYYYLMVFNNQYRVKVAARNINMPGVQNFRDLGGYKAAAGKNIRWGMLYRSGEINHLQECSFKKLEHLGIKTIIDLRSNQELANVSPLQKGFNVVHIPIATGSMDGILKDLQQKKIKGDTISRIIKKLYKELTIRYQPEYKKIFEVLLNKENYPIVFHCSEGKGRTDVIAALILTALGVNPDIIMEDYHLSNNYLSIPKAVSKYAYKQPVQSQEAITTLFSTQDEFLNAAKEEIEKNYGDVDTYLKKGLGLNKEKRALLRDILLE